VVAGVIPAIHLRSLTKSACNVLGCVVVGYGVGIGVACLLPDNQAAGWFALFAPGLIAAGLAYIGGRLDGGLVAWSEIAKASEPFR
jgi:hypothetical protein